MMEPPPAIPVTITVDGFTRTVTTIGADITTEIYPNLDGDIAALVKWCLAGEGERPVLEALYASVSDLRKMATAKRYERYPMGKFESDKEIKRIVQRYILDA